MSYQLSWQVPDSVLCIKLGAHVSADDFVQINEDVNACLDMRHNHDPVTLILDTTETESIPRELSFMRGSQTYADRRDVKRLLTMGSNKQVRLILLLTFNLSRAPLQFVDNYEHADRFINSARPMNV